jgi:dimethylhistidine N-methyltransferase
VRNARDLAAENEFASDVREGLRAPQKTIPPRYFYDAVGSALFEAITLLPEYGLTRAEERLLRRHADEMAQSLAPVSAVVELGSGSGRKTQQILSAIAKRQHVVPYFAIDVSSSSLESCCDLLRRVEGVRPRAVQSSYLEGLAKVREQLPREGRILLLFLGSTIGNFAEDEMLSFLRRVRGHLRAGDVFMMGTDLVKSSTQLLAAYDDAAGITAAFNLNLLARINRELNGNFELRRFRHEARWVADQSRIEMHLVSKASQSVTIAGAKCEAFFEDGESIWTESSRKFLPSFLQSAATHAGFAVSGQWVDQEWPFAENLWIAD